MSTGAIIAIVIVVLIVLALLAFVLPRMRARARVRKRERELAAAARARGRRAPRRGRAAHRPGRRRPSRRPAWPSARREAERAEAELRQQRASLHERGMADDELIDDHERERFAGTSAMQPADDDDARRPRRRRPRRATATAPRRASDEGSREQRLPARPPRRGRRATTGRRATSQRTPPAPPVPRDPASARGHACSPAAPAPRAAGSGAETWKPWANSQPSTFEVVELLGASRRPRRSPRARGCGPGRRSPGRSRTYPASRPIPAISAREILIASPGKPCSSPQRAGARAEVVDVRAHAGLVERALEHAARGVVPAAAGQVVLLDLEPERARRPRRSRAGSSVSIATKSGSPSWRAETLTPMVRPAPPGNPRHSASCAHAASSTWRPSGTTRPGLLGDGHEVGGRRRRRRRGRASGTAPRSRRCGRSTSARSAGRRPRGAAARSPGAGRSPCPAARLHLLVHGGVEHGVAALAVGLGAVHGDVGVAHDLLPAWVGGGERDADAARVDEQLAPVELERAPGAVLRRARRSAWPRRGSHTIVEQHRELVAAQARDGVVGAQRARSRAATACSSWSPTDGRASR